MNNYRAICGISNHVPGHASKQEPAHMLQIHAFHAIQNDIPHNESSILCSSERGTLTPKDCHDKVPPPWDSWRNRMNSEVRESRNSMHTQSSLEVRRRGIPLHGCNIFIIVVRHPGRWWTSVEGHSVGLWIMLMWIVDQAATTYFTFTLHIGL